MAAVDPLRDQEGLSGDLVESLSDVALDRLSAFAGHHLPERSQLFGLLTQHLELFTGLTVYTLIASRL
jgi:hypothetical protein